LATEKNLVVENLMFHTHTGHQKVEALNQILHNSLIEEDLCNEDHRIRFWELEWWVTLLEGEMEATSSLLTAKFSKDVASFWCA
jgi:hypothetical protein